MTRRIEFTDSARSQFTSAIRYIQADDPPAAQSFRSRAEDPRRKRGARADRLKEFPESGRSIPEFPELSYRELIVPPYRFFYTVRGGRVLIVGVWHSAQLPNAP